FPPTDIRQIHGDDDGDGADVPSPRDARPARDFQTPTCPKTSPLRHRKFGRLQTWRQNPVREAKSKPPIMGYNGTGSKEWPRLRRFILILSAFNSLSAIFRY